MIADPYVVWQGRRWLSATGYTSNVDRARRFTRAAALKLAIKLGPKAKVWRLADFRYSVELMETGRWNF